MKRKKSSGSIKSDILLILIAIVLTIISVLLIIKNPLIMNIFKEKNYDNSFFESNQTQDNKLIDAKKTTKNTNIKILKNESFLIQPPEIKKLEEELKQNQRNNNPKNKKIIKLYFIKVTPEGYFLRQTVKRAIFYDKNILEETLKSLIKGPNEYELKNNFLSLIPIKTKLLNLNLSEGIAKINLSKEFYENSFGIEGIINQIAQITLTCLGINGINGIILTIENNPIILEELNLNFSGILNKKTLDKY
ncbi:GerMN domain-containing protein [Borreliella andersonii]|uniref:GerMN domain-containing protein n=1 Tax=Borrelia andersonii TaxID=42109 RepID=A0ABZ0CF53_BORAD|nr:GerMN domain-containing protein [Borreliella andersonii]WNY65948.1 GerMN domain-containing protein [Borreliella andersonii]